MFRDIAHAVKGAPRGRGYVEKRRPEKAVDDSWRNFEMAGFMSSEQRTAFPYRPICGGGAAREIWTPL